MLTLNLNVKKEGDIKVKVSPFPDGQQDITILNPNQDTTQPVTIQARFDSFKDLELIICATQALRRLKFKEIHLHIPYVLGARSDRQFVDGGTSYLVDVVAPILNSQNYESVTCIDAHSDVAAACIKNLVVKSNCSFVQDALNEISIQDSSKFVFVSPDGGSLKKVYKAAEYVGFTGEVIICSKHRDTSGKLTKTIVPLTSTDEAYYIIIDDICDGGRTFINIASEIKKQYEGSTSPYKIFLLVTHGVFSAGLDHMKEYFDHVYCTNSYQDLPESSFVTQIDVF